MAAAVPDMRATLPHGPQRPRHPYPQYCFALLALVSVLCAFEPRLVHWFLVPVVACGLIVGKDAMDWLSGRVDLFDPRGVVAAVAVHLFFLAPLLLVFWDIDYDVVPGPADWRPWLGIMAVINGLGFLIYSGISGLVSARGPRARHATGIAGGRMWELDRGRALGVLVPAVLLAALAQVYLWLQFGGITGQIEGYKSMAGADVTGRFKYQLLAGAFPVLLLMLLTALRRRGPRDRGGYSLAFVLLAATFVIYFLVDGLRGSRSATVWTLFWATGIIHYFWRRLSARLLLVGLIPLLLFMYFYGFYKSYGDRVLDVYARSEGLSELSERTGRTGRHLVIRDLSRADVQAFLLYRLLSETAPYELTWGATYAETIPRALLPRALWPGRPAVARKALAGAQIHFGGPNPYGDGISKVYGLAGEGMLNFHLPGALLGFAVFGLAMGLYRRYLLTWLAWRALPAHDARLFLAPFLANWFLAALIGDFDNLVTLTLTKAVFPAAVLLLVVRWRRPGSAS